LDNNEGQHVATYVPTKAGDYKLNIAFDGTNLPNSPYNVKVIPASSSANNTIAEGEGLKAATAGTPETIGVIVKDRFDNQVTKGGDNINANMISADGTEIAVAVKDNQDGTYTLTYDPKTTGEYTLTIKLADDNIKDAPFQVVVAPAELSADNCEISGDGTKQVVAGETGAFHVQAKDKFGNKLEKGGNALTGEFTGPESVRVCSSLTNHFVVQ